MDNVTENVRILRVVTKTSQQKAAETCGVEQATFSRWEGSGHDWTLKQLMALADLFAGRTGAPLSAADCMSALTAERLVVAAEAPATGLEPVTYRSEESVA